MQDYRHRVISHAVGWEWRHHCHSERPGVSIHSNDLIQRAISKCNCEEFSTSFYFRCIWTRRKSSLSIRKTRCTNPFERRTDIARTIKRIFDSPGNFEVQLWNNLHLVLFPILLDQKDVIIVDLKNPVYQYLIQKAVSKYNYERISTPCYLPCFGMGMVSSLLIRKTRCINFERFDSEGSFGVRLWKDFGPL